MLNESESIIINENGMISIKVYTVYIYSNSNAHIINMYYIISNSGNISAKSILWNIFMISFEIHFMFPEC